MFVDIYKSQYCVQVSNPLDHRGCKVGKVVYVPWECSIWVELDHIGLEWTWPPHNHIQPKTANSICIAYPHIEHIRFQFC